MIFSDLIIFLLGNNCWPFSDISITSIIEKLHLLCCSDRYGNLIYVIRIDAFDYGLNGVTVKYCSFSRTHMPVYYTPKWGRNGSWSIAEMYIRVSAFISETLHVKTSIFHNFRKFKRLISQLKVMFSFFTHTFFPTRRTHTLGSHDC